METLCEKRDFTKEYFKMNESDAVIYAREVLSFFDEDASLECKEIGDGNLNYIFRVIDIQSQKSIIIKQAGPVARISDEFKLSTDRNRIESEVLEIQYKLTNGDVPKVYKYDSVMNCCVMDDLSDYIILRKAFLEHKRYSTLAKDLAGFMSSTLILTSDIAMGYKEKKELVKKIINPELCEISEDLVYTEPFYDCYRNEITNGNKVFVKSLLWEDKKFLLETAKLKFNFMNKSQSLIHGDLHSGSVFVKEGSTKIIDPEFAFFGPAGYDVGNVIAHYIFAIINAKYTIEDRREREGYIEYLKLSIVEIIDTFSENVIILIEKEGIDHSFKYDGFKEFYLNDILKDSAAICGLELCRRIIGLAHVKDIEVIEPSSAKLQAERTCLKLGKEFIINKDNYLSGLNYKKIIERFV